MRTYLGFFAMSLTTIGLCEVGCEWNTNRAYEPQAFRPEAGADQGLTETCDKTEIDRWKELLVIDPIVLTDSRAKNEVSGAPWSFRTRLEELSGGATQAAAFTRAWLSEIRDGAKVVVGDRIENATSRPGLDVILLEPWRRVSKRTAICDGGYECPAPELAIDHAPFRLIAIVNRLDLRDNDEGCGGRAGELRYVYTATNALTQNAIAMNVIVEVPYPVTKTAHEWARQWHELGQLSFGDEYLRALDRLTREVSEGVDPKEIRVRTNEIALGEPDAMPWELREFRLRDDGHGLALSQVLLEATPRFQLNESADLAGWVIRNKGSILSGPIELPLAMRGLSAPMPDESFRWDIPNVDPETRRQFSAATCNGCHGGERPRDSLLFEHLAPPDLVGAGYYEPAGDGQTRVSRYLNNPNTKDELKNREDSLRNALCASCEPRDAGTHYTATPKSWRVGGACR